MKKENKLKNRIKKIVREFVGMPEHFKDKKYLESVNRLYADPITEKIVAELQKETKRAKKKKWNLIRFYAGREKELKRFRNLYYEKYKI